MRFAWIAGWATPTEWFRAMAERVFPEAEHVVVPAAPDWRERLGAAGPADVLGAYSLGSLLVLGERERAAARYARVGLLAPIWAFPAEAGRGGRATRAQVRALARRTRVDATAATAGFYREAGLAGATGEIEPAETLAWGLTQLETTSAARGLPAGWWAGVGERDVLLDAEVLRAAEPAVRVVAGADHAPEALMRAWVREVFA